MNITALIVTWNRLPQLKKTIKATLLLPFEDIVVVNNASTDGTDSWLSQLTDVRLHIINANANLGGSEGFYLGSEYINQRIDTDWVVFYDDDAWPAPDFFEHFEQVDKSQSAVICTKVIDCEGQPCKMNLPWLKRTVTWRDNIAYLRGDPSFVVEVDTASKVISCSFVGAIVNAKVLQETYSLIHRELFIYFDDVYYGYHLHLLGYKLSYIPKIVMYHDIGNRPKSQIAPWKIYYLVRNMLLAKYLFPHNSFFTWPAILLRISKYLVLTFQQPHWFQGISLFIRAIKDGLTNRSTPLGR